MFKLKNFRGDATQIITTSIQIAEKLRFNYLGTEHILICGVETNHPKMVKLKEAGLTKEVLANFLRSFLSQNEQFHYKGEETSGYIKGSMMSKELESIIAQLAADNDGSYQVTGIELLNKILDTRCIASEIVEAFKQGKIKGSPASKGIPKALAPYGKNLTALAIEGKLEPVIGRDQEVERMINVLMRKNKCNPCVVGEAGVGKTAIVEGLAQRIANNDVPKKLQNKIIFSVNMGSILAGSKFRGDFEEKMDRIIKAVIEDKNIILFFDEIHTIIGAGSGQEQTTDAANALKPALARGEMQIIGATTISEYKKKIEKDLAFERRLEAITVDEPSVDETVEILKGIKKVYEDFHGVTISDETLVACAKLSGRYITDKFLPDKAITVLDESAARVATNLSLEVTKKDIALTIKLATGINVDDLTKNENERLANLENELNSHVIGQEEAVSVVAKAIKRSRSGLKNPDRPIGSFIFVGPTGVGKTELGKSIAKYLNGTEKSLIKLDMSEYMEKHSVAKLIGAPPGYVGFDDGGQLTDRVKRNPYSVILFDEIEKAHPEVSDILLQILDEGTLTDSRGKKVDFKNTVIVITSNIGSKLVSSKKPSIGFGSEAEDVTQTNRPIVMDALKAHFRPEFLNRLDNIVLFNALDSNSCKKIAAGMLDGLKSRVEGLGINVTFDETVVEEIVLGGFDENMGARNIKREIQTVLDDNLADEIIDGNIKEGDSIVVSIKKGVVSFDKVKEAVCV